MKPSRYNHFFPYDEDNSVAYNALTNALALIENHKLEAFRAFCSQGTPLPEDLEADLKKGMFIIEDFLDELVLLRFRMLQSRYNTDFFGLTIVPTNGCNFACSYCYQNDVRKNVHMSQDVQDKLVELLESKVKTIRSFSVCWFGGEPLMAFDVVESLSQRFMEICEKHEVDYSASMITNGYLLTPDILERLGKIKCNSLQITVDGTPEVHNVRRPLAGGGATFERIMDNLKVGHELLPMVSLRINVDKNNIQAGEYILDFLTENGLRDKVMPYFGKLENYGSDYDDSDCLNMCDFSEHSYEYFLRINKDNIDANMSQYPISKSSSCGADNFSASVVDAEGSVCKCWCDIGVPDRQVGSIMEALPPPNNLYFEYMMLDATAVEPCKDCNLLPICMGGCPFKRLSQKDSCTNQKFILERTTRNAIETLKKRREKEESVGKEVLEKEEAVVSA